MLQNTLLFSFFSHLRRYWFNPLQEIESVSITVTLVSSKGGCFRNVQFQSSLEERMHQRPLPPFSLDFLSQSFTWPLCEQNTQASRLQARDMSYQDQPSQLLWGLGYSIKLLPVTEEDVCVFLHKKTIVYFMSCSDEQRAFIFTIATFLLASILNVHCVEMIGFSML